MNSTPKPTVNVNTKKARPFKTAFNKTPMKNYPLNSNRTTLNSAYNHAFYPNNNVNNSKSPTSVNSNINSNVPMLNTSKVNQLNKKYTVSEKDRSLFSGLSTLPKNLLAAIGMAGGKRRSHTRKMKGKHRKYKRRTVSRR